VTPKPLTSIVSMILLAFGLITACTATPTPTPTITPTPAAVLTPTVSRDKAIEAAISGCKIPHLVLVGDPQNIRAKLATLEEADQQMRAPGDYTNYGKPSDYPVWLVQMDGELQLIGGPPVLITQDGQLIQIAPTSQPFWGTCNAIVDAVTGSVIAIYNNNH